MTANRHQIELLRNQSAQVQRRRKEIEHQEAALFEERQVLMQRQGYIDSAIDSLSRLDSAIDSLSRLDKMDEDNDS